MSLAELSDKVSNWMNEAEDKIVYDKRYYNGRYYAFLQVLDEIEDMMEGLD